MDKKNNNNNSKTENSYDLLKYTFLKNNPMENGRGETTVYVKFSGHSQVTISKRLKEVVAKELKTLTAKIRCNQVLEQKVSMREKLKQRQ